MKVALLDYGGSNIKSVYKALHEVSNRKMQIFVTSDESEIRSADKLVFPGQGAMGNCMHYLKGNNLDNAIKEHSKTKPFLGICLGLQCLMSQSEENGGTEGLNLIHGSVKKFFSDKRTESGILKYKVPHMGWNSVQHQSDHPVLKNIPNSSSFYFVHSYYIETSRKETIVCTTDFISRFPSVLAKNQIFATQFHPEKSSILGLKLLKNFLNW